MFRLIVFICIFLHVSCGAKENSTSIALMQTKDSSGVKTAGLPEQGEITELGIVREVEDSGYPFATVTIEFPERKFKETFTINMEEVEQASMTKLKSYVGKYVKFRYTSELTYALLDMYYNSKSIFGSEAAPEGEGIKTMEGVLYGAESVTSGDLPGEISIFAEDGENIYFQYFITDEMVAVNEKKVTGFYDTRVIHTIQAIQLSN